MKVKILPSKVWGSIMAPASKSYTHRSIILAALANGKSVIKNPLLSDDTLYTISACKQLGTQLKLSGNALHVKGVNGCFRLDTPVKQIFCGNSGTTARLMTSVATLTDGDVVIDGESWLRERPMKELIEALQIQGVKIKRLSNKHSLPIKVQGGFLKGGKVTISGNASSQFISSLLIVSPYAQKNVSLHISNFISKPYIDITIDLMKTFGVFVERDNHTFHIASGQRYKGREYQVEGDYTSASYFLAAAAITKSSVSLKNLKVDSMQGDRFFLTLLKRMGCEVKQTNAQVTVRGGNLLGIEANLGNYPDIVPTLCAVAANADGTTTITNIGHLRKKETDRIFAIATELRKMGIEVNTTADAITIRGGVLHGAKISTYNDHRIAMSFAIAAIAARDETIINHAEVVSKSYPSFFTSFKKIGAKITIL